MKNPIVALTFYEQEVEKREHGNASLEALEPWVTSVVHLINFTLFITCSTEKDICYIFCELIYISIKRKDGVRYHQPVFFRAPTLLSRPISVKQGI